MSFQSKGYSMVMAIFRTKPATETQARWDAFGMGVFLSVLGAGVLLASWLLAQQASTNYLVNDLSQAARHGQIHKLAQAADWDSLRTHLKHDLKNRTNTKQIAQMSDEQIDQLVDFYVRPQNLGMLLAYYNDSAAKNIPVQAFIRHARFSGLTELTLDLAPPPQFDRPWMNEAEPVKAVFALDGLSWKLVRLSAPDYLLPKVLPASGTVSPIGVEAPSPVHPTL